VVTILRSTAIRPHYDQRIIYTPYWGWYTPIEVNTHPKLYSPIEGVCTVLVVYSYTA